MCLLWSAPSFVAQRSPDIDLLMNLEPFDKWINVANIDLPFDTYHPQGIVKIGDEFFLTATDSRMAGYMIKFSVRSSAATMIQQTRLADPSFPNRIHPGGIDYDSSRNRIWCPLAERLPNTSTSILMVNPDDLAYENVGSILDHLGTTIVDAEDNRVRMIDYHTGMYSFQLKPGGTFPSEIHTADKFILPNEPIEYQDCKHLEQKYALCAGTTAPHRVDLIHFDSDKDGKTATIYSIARRFPLGNTNLGREAMTFEILDDASGRKYVRFYFKPDDGANTKLRVYEAHAM